MSQPHHQPESGRTNSGRTESGRTNSGRAESGRTESDRRESGRTETSRPGNPTVKVLGIHRIEPIDLTDPAVREALDRTREALTNPRLQGILTIRTAIQQYLCGQLAIDGYVHPPIYMLAGSTDPLNHYTFPARINYYGEQVSVTQSLILQKILMVMFSPAERVFWASPNIRMEMGSPHKGRKYATEFMQVDFEKKGATCEEMLGYIDRLTRGLYDHLRKVHGELIEELRGEPLPHLGSPLEIFDAADYPSPDGTIDYDAVERLLSERSGGRPFIIVNMKREAYDAYDSATGRFLNYDIVVPPFGRNAHPVECLSGAERTRSLADLEQRMVDLGYPMDYFGPFLELFRSLARETDAGDKPLGHTPITSAGGGFGVERLTYALLGLSDIHEVYPFPRPSEGKLAM